MKEKFVYYGYVDICDDVFTEDRLCEWKKHIIKSYKKVYEKLRGKIDFESPIQFFLSPSLLDEVIVDAVIGMRKITNSEYNSVENPNAFKIAAYLSYWWLRHKPVSVHYPVEFSLEDVTIKVNGELSDEDREEERQKMIWRLKHINELVAVEFVVTYIFNLDKELCGGIQCAKIKVIEGKKFGFKNYDEMLKIFVMKLTYYFSYRAIAPKMIEHLLEAYTFHPAWCLTGAQWNFEKQEDDICVHG